MFARLAHTNRRAELSDGVWQFLQQACRSAMCIPVKQHCDLNRAPKAKLEASALGNSNLTQNIASPKDDHPDMPRSSFGLCLCRLRAVRRRRKPRDRGLRLEHLLRCSFVRAHLLVELLCDKPALLGGLPAQSCGAKKPRHNLVKANGF